MGLKISDWGGLVAGYAGLIALDMEFGDVIPRAQGGLFYLATPYSREVLGRDGTFCPVRSDAMGQEAARWQMHCMANGVAAVSPIAQAVAMLNADPGYDVDPLDAGRWMAWCAPMLAASKGVIVPAIAGWQRSEGIFTEVSAALKRNMPVYLVKPDSEYGRGV